MAIKLCVFDAYGTLFDVAAAAREAAEQPENHAIADCWREIARDWRLKQLQYTWLRAITGAHCDFWQVTGEGLDWAMAAQGIDDARLRQVLMDLYWQLSAYAEVPEMLRAVQTGGLQNAILSNGSPEMLGGAVQSAEIAGQLSGVLSVEEVGIFKPDARVYALVEQHFDVSRDEVLFVSSNGWDAAGAAGFGFKTVWVNRMGEPVDQLPWKPTHILPDLVQIPKLAGVTP